MNDSVNPNHIGDDSVQRTSLGRRLQHALTGGPNRRFPGLHSPPGGAASTSLLANRRLALPILAILALLAASLLFLLPGGLLHAQDDSTIEYAEGGTGPVAVFTATDPESAGAITWSLATGSDAEDFEIDKASGVLTFAESPDYETPGDADSNNEYTVTVVATDEDGIASNEVVTVGVTNVEEPGEVTLSAVAPYPGVRLIATLADTDKVVAGSEEWQWSRSASENGSYAAIEDADKATYDPTSGDVGYYLRATVAYDDEEGEDKSMEATSAHEVQAVNVPNNAPSFPDQNPDEDGDQSDAATRMVVENTDSGEDVGDPVEAQDANGDILTYTLGDTGVDEAFDIDQATGQIKTKADLDTEVTPSYTVTVMAMDPAGLNNSITVTITVTNVNEPPDITGAVEPYAENGDGTVAIFTAMDPETETAGEIAWDFSGTDAALFELDNNNGELTFNDPPNYEMPGDADGDNVYEVTVGATDSDGIRGVEDVEVKVTNMEEDGTVTLSRVQPRVGVPVTASVTDVDGAVSGVKWQWYNESVLTQNAIEDATSDTYTPVVVDVGRTLWARASYTDPQGPDSASGAPADANVVAVDIRNKAPMFAADQDADTDGEQAEAARTVAEDAVASVNGGVVTATDPNAPGDILTYTLGGPDASSFDIDAMGQITVGAGAKLDFETKSTYLVTVIATDSFGLWDSVEVIITVTDVNEGPTITGTTEVEYPENGTGSVAVFTATDPENAGAIAWSLADSGDAGDFEIDKANGVLTFAESPDYETPGDADSNNEYTVTVVATDEDGIASNEVVTVGVTNVEEPGEVTLSAVAPYPGVRLIATLADTDKVVAGSEEWQWSRSASENGSYAAIEDADKATYDPTSGDVGYYLRATVAYDDEEGEDKSMEATSAHEVQAVNVPNNAPSFPDQNPDEDGDQSDAATRMVVENTDSGEDVGDPVEAQDANGDILTYTLGDTGVDEAFDIDQATGQIKTKADLDTEVTPSYTVTVMAMDPAGLNNSITVTITVTNVNEPPDITGAVEPYAENGDGTVAIFTAMDPETETAGEIAWDFSGTDAALFELDNNNGELTFNDPPNYEMPGDADGDNVYEVTVGATDSDGIRGVEDVEVKVTNMEEDGTVTLSRVQPRVGVPVTASVTDVDGAVSGVKWQWYNESVLTQNAIEDATSDTYTPVVVDVGRTLWARASYTDPQGPDSASGAPADANVVAVDTRNKAPMFAVDQDADTDGEQAEAARTVAEDAAASASVNGGVVTATDPNAPEDILTYTLGGPGASSFDIDAMGQITVGAGAKLDFETKSTYLVTVIATDSFGIWDSVEVIITVTDVNEGPVITVAGENVAPEFADSEDGARSVAENTVAGEDIGNPVAARDANGDALTYTLSGTDAASFDIDQATGQLKTKADLDYETKASYAVTVTATDGDTASDSIDVTITITVTDVDEMVTGDDLVDRYDADDSGDIGKTEVLKAINDYLFGEGDEAISKPEVLRLINIYLFG